MAEKGEHVSGKAGQPENPEAHPSGIAASKAVEAGAVKVDGSVSDVEKKTVARKLAEEAETREDLALLRMIVSLMEDVAKTVLRVERLLNERFSLLEKRVEEVREDLANRVESVELKGVSKLEETLEKAVNNLQKGMEIMAIRDLVEKVEDLAIQIREKTVKPEKEAPKEERREAPPPAARKREPGPAKPARTPAPSYEEPKPAEEERLIRPSDLFRRGY
ncbi:MAG: hypothetical protein KIH01_05375 [Candidatus Freyarchaeota archaeon]|nr:hypothetical protein [Candidatus Jordarchaeia archaeon]